MSEIEKCAWCGKEPEPLTETWGEIGNRISTTCSEGCPHFRLWQGRGWWNRHQLKILALRRKDFEKGAEIAGAWDAGLFNCMAKAASKAAIGHEIKSYVKKECEFYATQCGTFIEEEWHDYLKEQP